MSNESRLEPEPTTAVTGDDEDRPGTDIAGGADTDEIVLGRRVQQLRRLRGISVRELARRSNLSRMSVTQIEAGAVNPSAGSLRRIADALGVFVGSLFASASDEYVPVVLNGRPAEGRIEIVRHDRRKQLILPFGNWRLDILTPDMTRRFQVAMDMLDPGKEIWHETHVSEEFAIVLEGSYELDTGTERYQADEGDCLYLTNAPPFAVRLRDDRPGRMLWVFLPPAL